MTVSLENEEIVIENDVKARLFNLRWVESKGRLPMCWRLAGKMESLSMKHIIAGIIGFLILGVMLSAAHAENGYLATRPRLTGAH